MSVVRSLSFCAVLLALTTVVLCSTATPEEQKAKGDAFIKWAKENGATVNSLRVSPDPRFGGFSIVASKSIHEGEEILRIPASKLIISRRSIIAWIEEIKKQQNPSDESSSSSSNGLVSPPSLATLTSLETASPEALGFLASMVPVIDEISNRINNDAHIFSFYILFHRSLGTKSPLYHWIQILPAQINSPIFFNDEDFSQLIGSDTHAKTLVLKNQTETFWKDSLIPSLKEKLESSTFTEDIEAFINQNYDLDSWRWAMSTVASRTVLYNSTIQIPLVYDFFNHLPQPPTKKPKLAIDRNGDFSVSVQRPYITGQQVYVDYGPLPNSHLLLFYGFALEDNKKRDSVAFHFTLDPEDPLRSEKETLLTSNNLKSDLFLLFQEQMSMEVQFYSRVRVADSVDLETIKKDIRSVFQKPISIVNERNAMSYIGTVAQSLLDRFPTDYKSDIEALAKPEGEIPRNGRNAILVRKVEKHILLRTHNSASGAVSSIDDAIKAQQAKLDTIDAPPVDQADIVL